MARDYALLWANGTSFNAIMALMKEDILSATEEEDPAEGVDVQGAGEEEQAADEG